MTRSIAVAVLLVLLVFSFAFAGEWVPFRDTPVAEEVATRIISTDISTTVIEIEIPGNEVTGYATALVAKTQAPRAMQRLADKRRELLLPKANFLIRRRCGCIKNEVRRAAGWCNNFQAQIT